MTPSSDMPMLRESSTSTAMMFCCGFNSAMVIAGCHSSISSIAAKSVCKLQITHTRQPRITGAACERRERISQARATAAAMTSSTSTQVGHAPKKRKVAARIHRTRVFKKEFEHGPVGFSRTVERGAGLSCQSVMLNASSSK